MVERVVRVMMPSGGSASATIGMRIGIDWDYIGDTDPEIVAAIKEALRVFASLGGIVTPVKVPAVDAVAALQKVIMNTAHLLGVIEASTAPEVRTAAQ